MINALKLSIIIILLSLTACGTSELERLSIHCLCVVDEHFSVSTEEDDNSVKEYTFTDSRLFDFGVERDDYALSAALFIYQNLDTATYNKLMLKFINPGKNNKTYIYATTELSVQIKTYSKIREISEQFVTDIYKQNYSRCIEKISPEISEDRIKEALENARKNFYDDYKTTEIAAYKKTKGGYDIFGAILTPENKTDLFKMSFAYIDGKLTIISFEF